MDWKERVKWILEDAIRGGELPGASVLVMQNGKELLFTAAGYADVEAKKPFTRDTIVRVYSMSKPFTGVAVLKLLEQGIIELGDDVARYLPGFQESRVYCSGRSGTEPAVRPLKLFDLVSMTAGVSYPGQEDSAALAAEKLFEEIDRRLYTEHPMTTQEIANEIGRLPMAFQPGSHFRYSTAADVAAAVVEVASGMPYSEFLKKEIIDPLGLADTGFYVPEEKQPRLAKAYEYVQGRYREVRTNHLGVRYMRDVEPAFASGGAGMVSTITDYSRFAAMELSGGQLEGVRILQPSTMNWLSKGQLGSQAMGDLACWSTERLRGYNYSFFHRVLQQPGQAIINGTAGEYGWDGWMGTFYMNDPKNHLTLLVFSQVPGAGNTRTVRRIRNVIYGGLDATGHFA